MELASRHEGHVVIVSISEVPLVFVLARLRFDHNPWKFVRGENEGAIFKHHARVTVFRFYDQALTFEGELRIDVLILGSEEFRERAFFAHDGMGSLP